MVSVVVVGPAISGKTHLCVMLAGLPTVPVSVYNETCSTNYLKTDVNGVPWHIWDTPRYEVSGWVAEEVAAEASVVVVCHDGRRLVNPCELVRQFGVDRCVIALTRTELAGANLSWCSDYYRTVTSSGTLVPVIQAYHSPMPLIGHISRSAVQGDSGVGFAPL
jgi:hypothetical protein